jgi:hypothetical protein
MVDTLHWLIDERLTENQYKTGFPSLADAAIQQGHEVDVVYYAGRGEPIQTKFGDKSFVVTHGTIQFCKQVERQFGRSWMPGLYFNDKVKLFHKFAAHIGRDNLVNSDYRIIPYIDLSSLNEMIFAKPLSGLKEFVGQVIDPSKGDDMFKITQGHVIDPDTLCVVATPRKIQSEFRYVIADKKVVTGSEYRWDNVLDVRRDTLPECDVMAQKVADMEWQADTVYVCDVAMTELGAKVVELNAFSSSGLYACDTTKIVEAVAAAAYKECFGE